MLPLLTVIDTYLLIVNSLSLRSPVSTVTRLWVRRPEFDSWQGQGMDFFFATVSGPGLGFTQLPLHWVLGALSLVLK
jgi:hypothetical protein